MDKNIKTRPSHKEMLSFAEASGIKMKWYNFFVFVYLPLIWIIYLIIYIDLSTNSSILTISLAQFIAQSIFLSLTAYFLWKFSFIAPWLVAVLFIFSLYNSAQSLIGMIYAYQVYGREFTSSIINSTFLIIFYILNIVYFYKRRHLFLRPGKSLPPLPDNFETEATEPAIVYIAEPETIPEEAELNPTPAMLDKPATYCKLCGAPIDVATRKCTGCGKQYASLLMALKRTNFAWVLAVVAAVVAAYYMYTADSWCKAYTAQEVVIADLEAQIDKQQNTILQQQKTIRQQESDIDQANTRGLETLWELTKLQYKFTFYEYNAVFVTSAGKKYHTLSCYHLNGSTYNIYTVDTAKSRGYTACEDCYKKLTDPGRSVDRSMVNNLTKPAL